MKKETERAWKSIEPVALLKAAMLAVDRIDMNRTYCWFARTYKREPAESKIDEVGHMRAVVDMLESTCITSTMFADELPIQRDWTDADGRMLTTSRILYSCYWSFRGDRTGWPLSWYERFRFIPAYVRKIRRYEDKTCDRPLVRLPRLLWVTGRDASDRQLLEDEINIQLARTAEDVPDPYGDYREDPFTDFAQMKKTLGPFVERNDPRTRCAYWNACRRRAESLE